MPNSLGEVINHPRPRPEVIEELVQRAIAAMGTLPGTSAIEVYSAMFTLTKRSMEAAQSMGVPLDAWRPHVEDLYGMLPVVKAN